MKISQASVDGLIENAKKVKIGGNISSKQVKLGGGISTAGDLVKLPIDYENDKHLVNRPQINDIEVIGNKSIEDYGVKTMTNIEIKQIFDRIFNKGGN